MKTPIFKIRCSALSKIMSGTIGLTDTQKATLTDLESRENGTHPKGLKLTARMEVELAELQHKILNPELPQGAKTYCKQWLKEYLYKRREQLKNKYVTKGHSTEEDGFTAMCVQLGLGMVYKNEEFKSNGWLIGTCDLDHEAKDTVYDNKSSWTLDQFPMFESECPNNDYLDQLQGYMELWNRGNGSVVYTLNNLPEEMLQQQFKPWLSDDEKQDIAINFIYTRDYWDSMKSKYFPSAKDIDFVEIPEEKRVKEFKVKRDDEFIKEAKLRVDLCQKYIETLLS